MLTSEQLYNLINAIGKTVILHHDHGYTVGKLQKYPLSAYDFTVKSAIPKTGEYRFQMTQIVIVGYSSKRNMPQIVLDQ